MDLVAFKARDKGLYVAALVDPGVADTGVAAMRRACARS